MRKIAVVFASLGALALPAIALGAPSQAECEAAGGTYTKEGSVATCTFPVGNSDNTKVTEQKGSFNSSHPEAKTNPGGNQPPGQQGGNDLGK